MNVEIGQLRVYLDEDRRGGKHSAVVYILVAFSSGRITRGLSRFLTPRGIMTVIKSIPERVFKHLSL